MNNKILVLCICFFVSISLNAQEKELKDSTSYQIEVGGAVTLNSGLKLGLSVMKMISPKTAVVLGYSTNRRPVNRFPQYNTDAISLGVRHYLINEGKMRPFLEIGAEYQRGNYWFGEISKNGLFTYSKLGFQYNPSKNIYINGFIGIKGGYEFKQRGPYKAYQTEPGIRVGYRF